MKRKKHKKLSPTQLAKKQRAFMDVHKTKRHRDHEELSYLIGRWDDEARRAVYTHVYRDTFSRSRR